jgi:hypothetical protein
MGRWGSVSDKPVQHFHKVNWSASPNLTCLSGSPRTKSKNRRGTHHRATPSRDLSWKRRLKAAVGAVPAGLQDIGRAPAEGEVTSVPCSYVLKVSFDSAWHYAIRAIPVNYLRGSFDRLNRNNVIGRPRHLTLGFLPKLGFMLRHDASKSSSHTR